MLQNLVSTVQISSARQALEDCPIGVSITDIQTNRRLFANQALADMICAVPSIRFWALPNYWPPAPRP